jgi:hypothetical protein
MISYIFNCNWFDTRWQQYSTHLHTNSTQNTENGTHITTKNYTYIKIKEILTSSLGIVSRALSLRVIPWNLPYNCRKGTEKPQLG